jgi:hypothetical protein
MNASSVQTTPPPHEEQLLREWPDDLPQRLLVNIDMEHLHRVMQAAVEQENHRVLTRGQQ